MKYDGRDDSCDVGTLAYDGAEVGGGGAGASPLLRRGACHVDAVGGDGDRDDVDDDPRLPAPPPTAADGDVRVR